MPPVARNDPLPVILVDLLPPRSSPPEVRALSRRRDSSRVITDGRVTGIKVQRTADDVDAWKSESRRRRRRTPRAGVDKKAAAYAREARMYRGESPESRSTALKGIHVGYLHGSAPTGAGLIFGRGRRRKKKKTKERRDAAERRVRHLSLSGALTTVRGECRSLSSALRADSKRRRMISARAF